MEKRRIFNSARNDVLRQLGKHPNRTAADQLRKISKATGLPRNRVASIVAQLSRENLVVTENGSWKTPDGG